MTSYLQGILQELLVVPDPTKVSQYCKNFMPNCDKPFSKDEMKIMAATTVAGTVTIGNVRYVSTRGFLRGEEEGS